jgi:hypothetical protein
LIRSKTIACWNRVPFSMPSFLRTFLWTKSFLESWPLHRNHFPRPAPTAVNNWQALCVGGQFALPLIAPLLFSPHISEPVTRQHFILPLRKSESSLLAWRLEFVILSQGSEFEFLRWSSPLYSDADPLLCVWCEE